MKFFLLIIIVTGWACKVTEPLQYEENNIHITVLDIGVREVYLNVQAKISSSNSSLVLQRDGKEIITFSSLSDTLLVDSTTEQGNTYKYKLVLKKEGRQISESNEIELTTLNPTSNNYNWQIIEFEGYNPAYFQDVAIVNENDIWAVGEVDQYNPDGTYDWQPYGAAHYDGNSWKLVKVPYRIATQPEWPGLINAACSADGYLFFAPLSSLLIKTGDTWKELGYFASGTVFTGQVAAVWSPDAYNIYCVGGSGSIYYCTSGNWVKWMKLNSGTSSNICDIYGFKDPATGKYTAYMAVLPPSYAGDGQILRITEKTKVDTVSWEPRHYIYSLWTKNGFPMYAGGVGLYANSGGKWKEFPEFHNMIINKIRGTGLNDIYAVGSKISHYNGIEWKTFDQLSLSYGVYNSVAVTENKIVAVGWNGNKAIIIVGSRY
ncbi:MAG TPA: hypothetical protein VHO03_18355 [Ignavibacteriales bacterium]|nr:hypothetical protein [Ignavibacteriales bacterium]